MRNIIKLTQIENGLTKRELSRNSLHKLLILAFEILEKTAYSNHVLRLVFISGLFPSHVLSEPALLSPAINFASVLAHILLC